MASSTSFIRRAVCKAWPDADRATRIVLIVDGLERAVSRQAIGRALSGAPQIDAPDLAALARQSAGARARRTVGLSASASRAFRGHLSFQKNTFIYLAFQESA